MVNRREIFINERLYEVEDIDRYVKNPDAYLTGYIAVDVGQDYILPIVPQNSTMPGLPLRRNSPFSYARLPEGDMAAQYHRSQLIDYSNASSFQEFVERRDMVRSLEKGILSSPDKIFTPPLDEEDTPAMRALKDAVVAKEIDFGNYETRMGGNFHNNRRLLLKSNISLPKLVELCRALDIEATLTLEDKDPDVANPMNKTITTSLTSGQDTSGE